MKYLIGLTTRLLAICSGTGLLLGNAQAVSLTPGSPAPGLTVGKWLKGTPVTTFRKGRTYVVEFWATWCGPCKQSIPHLTELQRQYKTKVQFVGVSVSERKDADLTNFMKAEGHNMGYSVASDPLGVMKRNWLAAAGQDGIPTAFIVDGSGRVAWIGHPLQLDSPLAEVVAGRWNVDVAKAAFLDETLTRNRKNDAQRQLQTALNLKQYDRAIALADRLIASGNKMAMMQKMDALLHKPDGRAAVALANEMDRQNLFRGMSIKWKYQALVLCERYDEAAKLGETILSHDPDWLSDAIVAQNILDETIPYKKRDLALAMKAAKRAIQKKPHELLCLETLAKAQFAARNRAEAVRLEEEAIKVAPAQVRDSRMQRLRRYQAG